MKRIHIVVVILVGALAIGVAGAAGKTPNRHLRRIAVKTAVSYLGIDRGAVRAQLKAGKSLADVAVANGKTGVGLEQSIVAAVKTKLDARVAAGKLKAPREQKLLSRLQTRIHKLVLRTRS